MLNRIEYPQIEIDLNKISENAKLLTELAQKSGVEICGVVKGSDSSPLIAKRLSQAGCSSIGDSRIENIARMKESGVDAEMLLLRIPMICEVEHVVSYADISLNSEKAVLEALSEEALKQEKTHKVILMMDLGDLREGYYDKYEMIDTAKYVEEELKGLRLHGIGTNLGCFGAIRPDVENLTKLCEISENVEDAIGRRLDIVSGGATSSLTLLYDEKMPKRINHLRVGEGILLARDLPDIWGYEMRGAHSNNFILKTQIIEIKEKPSHPVGQIFIDAFGNTPEYEDKGIRKRALAAIGKKDIGHHDSLIPRLEGLTIEGSSSDHLILDITDCHADLKVGDILEFDMYYQAMLYLMSSDNVKKIYIE